MLRYVLPIIPAVALLVVLSSCGSGSNYVVAESLEIPVDGTKVVTHALRPGARYVITISSSDDIDRIYSERMEKAVDMTGLFGWIFPSIKMFVVRDSDVVFGDEKQDSAKTYDKKSVTFDYRGDGRPLPIGLGKDHSSDIKTAHAQVDLERETLLQRWDRRGAPVWFWVVVALVIAGYVVTLTIDSSSFVKRFGSYLAHAREEQEKRELIDQAENWRLRVYKDRNYLDKEFREQYVKNKSEKIVAKKTAWAQEYDEVMKNEKLASLLKREYPEVVEYLEARQEMIVLEQRNAVMRERRQGGGRITHEQWRERAVRVVKTKAEDEAAKFFAGVEIEMQMVDAIEAMIEEIKENESLSEQQKEERIRRVRLAEKTRIKALGGEDEQEIQTVL